MKIKCSESGCKKMYLPFDDDGKLRLSCPNCMNYREAGDK